MIKNKPINEASNVLIGEPVEFGIDPLSLDDSLPNVERGDSLLRDYSFCKVEHGSCRTPSPTPRRKLDGEYVFPNSHTHLDSEHRLSDGHEPYVLMENPCESENTSLEIVPPGVKLEQQLQSISHELPSPSSSSSYKSAHEEIQLPTSYKPRANPFVAAEKLPRCERRLEDPSSYNTFHSEPPRVTYTRRPSGGAYPTSYRRESAQSTTSQNRYGEDISDIDEMVTALRVKINNAVQYFGMLGGSNFEASSSICFLGKFYYGKHQQPSSYMDMTETISERVGTFKDFLLDFKSRIWVTYRKGFPALKGRNLVYTSDTGWGCMLRTGQMMLATVLQIHTWNRDWRHTPYTETQFKDIIRFFGDTPDYPFSLHNLLKIGKDHLNKPYGEWYGPSSVAYVLRVCLDYVKEKIPNLPCIDTIRDFVIFTATDCMIFQQDIINVALNPVNYKKATPLVDPWCKTLLLVSVRLGADELNMMYKTSIQQYLSSPICIGIMGGRKRHSLYFVGFQGSKLIHFDPHICHPSIRMKGNFDTETYVCEKPRKMSFSKMDPSCTFAFYLRSHKDMDDLVNLTNTMEHKVFEILPGTKEEYLSVVTDASRVKAFSHNESMFDDHLDINDIASLEGSDFEYLE